MIETIRPPFSMEPSVHIEEQKNSTKWREIFYKVWEVAQNILLTLVNVALFIINPSLYAIGFFVGIIVDEKVQEVADKIVMLWKKQTIEMTLLTVIGGALSIQITAGAASIFFGAHLGSNLVQRAKSALAE